MFVPILMQVLVLVYPCEIAKNTLHRIRLDLTFVPGAALYQVNDSTGGFASLEQLSTTVRPSARGPDVPSVASVNRGASVGSGVGGGGGQ